MTGDTRRVNNRLGEIRRGRGVAAADLARRVGVSRQTIYAIEEGSFVPNTTIALELARALEVTVERLFTIEEETSEPLGAELLNGSREANRGELVQLCRVNKRLTAIPVSFPSAYLPRTDGIVVTKRGLRVGIEASADAPENGKRLLLAGCDPAFSLLEELLGPSGSELVSFACSSRSALRLLKQGRVHAAGSHLLDRATGAYNLPIIRRLFARGSVRVVTFAVWEQGLVLARGNPKSIRAVADLGEKGIRLMNRDKGSGSRDLLDRGLRKAGIESERVAGYACIAQGHLAAAYAVAAGSADCCIASRSAARCFGLEFVPLAVERFDLSFTKESFEMPAAKAVLDTLARASLRRKLAAIAGYDTAHTGEVIG